MCILLHKALPYTHVCHAAHIHHMLHVCTYNLRIHAHMQIPFGGRDTVIGACFAQALECRSHVLTLFVCLFVCLSVCLFVLCLID